KAFVYLSLIGILLYWKFLLTHQFSLLTGYEQANQAYAWYNYIAHSIKDGVWPIWDQFSHSGRNFAGEMQTAAFYPLNLLISAIPFNNKGLFSPALYHWIYFATHVLGAYFTFVFVRRLGLSFLASLLSGICFSFGGFMARLGGWPHLYQSGIWLPLICLFAVNALKSTARTRALAWSILSGLCLGLSVLAGGLHVVIMQGIVLVTLCGAWIFFSDADERCRMWKRAALVCLAAVLIALMAGAVQLLPSAEYGHHALRWVHGGTVGASEKIPYNQMWSGLLPNAIFGLLFGAPASQIAVGEYLNPYIGVLPFLLAVLAVWKCWKVTWVRYFSVLFCAVFVYSLGSFSLFHGAFYATIPYLWMAREASRFMYLASFSLAVLAGFGVDRIYKTCLDSDTFEWASAKKILRWFAAGCALVMAISALWAKADVGPWGSFSLLLIIMSCGLLLYVLSGHRDRWSSFLVIALVMFDLYAFDWTAANRAQEAAKGNDQFERLLSFEGGARYLRAQNAPFRVHFAADLAPNVGDLYGLQATWGGGVTVPRNYDEMRNHLDLLNVRYIVRPVTAGEPNPVYQDAAWKIYENPTACPRAWLVHKTEVERSPSALRMRLDSKEFDPRRVALLPQPLPVQLDPVPETAVESVRLERYEPRRVELNVQTQGRALLVLSEVFYPGWKATVNGRETNIVEADRALRGILVPAGASRVIVAYEPRSVFAGATLTIASFCLLPVALVLLRRKRGRAGDAAQ
ncbi:MAG: hypothetical protein ABFD60_03845, partial [Bryobacteraceae bacterium]